MTIIKGFFTVPTARDIALSSDLSIQQRNPLNGNQLFNRIKSMTRWIGIVIAITSIILTAFLYLDPWNRLSKGK